jgi:protein-L-isoaspartate(D-aspartate) O-methyltransferase
VLEPYSRFNSAKLVLALRQAGVTDLRYAEAFEKTPREPFVPTSLHRRAWDNIDLPIDCGQTMTRPVTIGRMIEALAPQRDHAVLEIGTGSGYSAAILGRLSHSVCSLERYRMLTAQARRAIETVGAARVEILFADGLAGYAQGAPFDRVLVNAALTRLPPAVVSQLSPGGVIVAPMLRNGQQIVVHFQRKPDGSFEERALFPSRFTGIEEGLALEL